MLANVKPTVQGSGTQAGTNHMCISVKHTAAFSGVGRHTAQVHRDILRLLTSKTKTAEIAQWLSALAGFVEAPRTWWLTTTVTTIAGDVMFSSAPIELHTHGPYTHVQEKHSYSMLNKNF